MMNSQQQLQFPISQCAGYYLLPGQFVPSAQQFPVASAPTGFYYDTYPDWSSEYGELYYPTQVQYQFLVTITPIIMSSAQQQQAPPPQFAPPQQHRTECQQLYYPYWPSQPSDALQVPSGAPYTVQPAHIYQNSPMMVIPQQQLQYPISQCAAYCLVPGQFVPSAQQFPVASAPTGFHYGTYPNWSSEYGELYYPMQAQYQTSVPTTPIILSSAQQQQALPPQYAPPQQFPVASAPTSSFSGTYPDWSSEYGELYYYTQDQDQSSVPATPIVFSSAQQQQAPPPQYAPPQQDRRECQQTVVTEAGGPVQTNGEGMPPTATVGIPPAASTPPPPSKVPFSDDIQLNKAEKAWRPSGKRGRMAEAGEDEPEVAETQDLLRRVRSILNKLTPQMFQPLMKQLTELTELTVDTEERLKGVAHLIYEKAISEPNFSEAYGKMCSCLMMLKVPTSGTSGGTVDFPRLLLNCCHEEFVKDGNDIFEHKQKELDAASEDEEHQRLIVEQDAAKDNARHRSLGNIKFMGELFNVGILSETKMHECIFKLLLKSHDEERLECLCLLLSTIGKEMEKTKPEVDYYFQYISKFINAKKTSLRIRFRLQDVLDLRQNNWVPRRGDQGPKTINQVHKEAMLEEHREQSKNNSSRTWQSRRGPTRLVAASPILRVMPRIRVLKNA
ncbi:uncharacterized protein LOC143484060 [Brachyhypopomus gauderio]|uniref:uncharacterized protein LOC143484060 n=1 Tax=Brachyhypopomus gauderio TaxID=698409 RepID=UPI004041AB54